MSGALYVETMNYIDDYKSCSRTYATLLIYTGERSPGEITLALGLAPTRVSVAQNGPRDKVNGWFLSSQGIIESKDSRRHIDYIVALVHPLEEKLAQIQRNGCRIEVSCFWESASGNGGPSMSPSQMKALGELNLELCWDIWFAERE